MELSAGALIRVANFASLPAHTAGVSKIRLVVSTNTVYISDGASWTEIGSGGNIDGGVASSVYGGLTTVDGGAA